VNEYPDGDLNTPSDYLRLLSSSSPPTPQQNFEGASEQQQMPNGNASHNNNNNDAQRRIDARVVCEKFKEAILPLFKDVLLNTRYPPLEIMGREFQRIAIELFRINNRRRDGHPVGLPYHAIPFTVGEFPASSSPPKSPPPHQHSQGASQQQPMTNGDASHRTNNWDREMDDRIVYLKLRSALVPFFEDVLLNTLHPPLKIVGDELIRYGNELLSLDMWRRGGHSSILPSLPGQTSASVVLPPVPSAPSIYDLDDLSTSSESPNTVEEILSTVAYTIRVLERRG
jgi:hypothetical protein